MKTPIPRAIPFGRIPDLYAHPDAHLLAVKPSLGTLDDWAIRRFASRAQLESFLSRAPGQWRAIVKNRVPPNCLIHPAFQSLA